MGGQPQGQFHRLRLTVALDRDGEYRKRQVADDPAAGLSDYPSTCVSRWSAASAGRRRRP